MNHLTLCLDIINQHEGKIMFNEPVVIKYSPHTFPVRVWGVWVNGNDLWLSDGEQWNEVTTKDINGRLVIAGVYQRLKWRYGKEVAVGQN
jgi:hypothetical protein